MKKMIAVLAALLFVAAISTAFVRKPSTAKAIVRHPQVTRTEARRSYNDRFANRPLFRPLKSAN